MSYVTHIETRSLLLRPVHHEDLAELYRICTDPLVAPMWRYRAATPSPQQFRDELFTGGAVSQYSLISRRLGSVRGMAVAYGTPTAGYLRVGVVAAPEVHRTGVAIEGVAAFCAWLFALWDLRKIYFEVLSANSVNVSKSLVRYCSLEGQFAEHDFFGNEYCDLLVYALYRDGLERFLARHQRTLRLKLPLDNLMKYGESQDRDQL